MAVPTFTMRQLLEAGVHFGHHTRRWNPKMEQYIFGIRNKVHIIDLQQTMPMLYAALNATRDIAAGGGRVLFVGTKRAASDIVAESAKKCGQYYVNHRWLGGMLTNWRTISNSITRLKVLDTQLSEEQLGLTKKELLHLTRERAKLDRALGGIREMGGLPDVVFIIDTNKEEIAKHEASKLGIPLVAVIDSNSDPDGIDYPIPGNDDATRSIHFYCDMMARTVLQGLQVELAAAGGDAGAKAEAPPQEALEPDAPKAVADAGAVTEPASEPAPQEVSAPPAAEKPAAEAAAPEPAATPPAAEKVAAEAATSEPASTPPATDEPAAPAAEEPATEPAAPEPQAEQPPAATAKTDTPTAE
jgi:small subunit ribosomal protein S2